VFIATLLLGLLSAAFYLVLLGLWNGYVLSILWSWFVVQFGLPTLTVPHAIGLALIGSLMVPYRKPDESKAGWGKILENLAGRFLTPLLCLGVGYVVKGYM
jgi:hypothetical protein